MYYEFLEDIAQTNRLKNLHPVIKIIFGLVLIIISVSSQSIIAPVLVIATMFLVTVFIAGINLKFYLKLLMIPLGFAVFSVIVIIFMRNSGNVVFSCPVFDCFVLTISTGSLNEGILIFTRVFAGMSSLFFISLTTPVTETFVILEKCHIPRDFIDLSMLIYRFIFVFVEQAAQIYDSQKMRLGYSGKIKEEIESFGMMAGALFINTWETGENLMKAMDSRCYDGKFAILEDNIRMSYPLLGLVLFYLIAVAAVSVFTSGFVLFGVV